MVEERRREKPDLFVDYAKGIVRSLHDDLLGISKQGSEGYSSSQH